jgi:hypothetical protein
MVARALYTLLWRLKDCIRPSSDGFASDLRPEAGGQSQRTLVCGLESLANSHKWVKQKFNSFFCLIFHKNPRTPLTRNLATTAGQLSRALCHGIHDRMSGRLTLHRDCSALGVAQQY